MDFWTPMAFVTVLLLVFALFMLIAGAFTAYFGSGKSRKIGAGLLVGGLVLGLVWGWLVGIGPLDQGPGWLTDLLVQTIGVLLAAIIGAAAAVGLFLVAIMKS